MSPDQQSETTVPTGRRYRNVSGLPLNRRVVMKAAAGLSATLMAGGAVTTPASRPESAAAQEVGGTRAREWTPAENMAARTLQDGDGWVTFETEFPFWAVGVGWDGSVGWWPAVDLQVSVDGENWGDVFTLVGRDDGGPKPADGRIYSDLFFADGEQFIRYRPRDAEDNLVELEGFKIVYIDPTDGPWDEDRATTFMRTTANERNTDTDVPPTIITRAQWGANESLRFEGGQEIWPPEYQTVQHAIVHHAAVNYGTDGYNAVRSIYYYHCVTQGWGDIGYNYVVDVNGNIFEGRVGGANVIGGHAFEYANGSSGICVMGDFSYQDAPAAAKAALAHILAYVTRDLNTYATRPFHQHPALPTICGHRDVVQSTCPGNGLYDDLPYLRDTVAATLDAGNLDSGKPGGIVPGDRVQVVTDDGNPLNMRSGAGAGHPVNGSIPNGTRLWIQQGPISDATANWYRVTHGGRTGWVSAAFLIVDPPIEDPTGAYTFGVNIRVSSSSYLRSSPSTSGGILATVPAGAWGFVMAGPTNANGYSWYQIRTQNHGDGWMSSNGFALAPVYNPAGQFSVGQSVVATTSAPIRVRPGIAQTTSGTASSGTTMVVSVAPISVTDRIWYGVHSAATGGGWVEQGHLRAGASGTPSGPVTAVGQQFQVTEALNMRSGAGTNYGIVATLPAGTRGDVIGGPTSASGYTWWQVRTSGGSTGWVVSNWIVRLTTSNPNNPSGFGKGVSVRTSIAVNLRQDAGTNYPIVATLASNANGTITDGPRIATGYTWWKVRATTGQEGWAVQDYLIRTSGPGDPEVQFNLLDKFKASQAVTLYAEASASSAKLATIAAGTTGLIVSAGTNAGGTRWWKTSSRYGAGWVTAAGLAKTNEAPSTLFIPGGNYQFFETTAATNLRSGAGTSYSVVAQLPAGTTGIAVWGSWLVNGYIWWKVSSGAGVGYIIEDVMRVTTKTPSTMFRPGAPYQYFRLSEATNLRSGAGTRNSVIAELSEGQTGIVLWGSWMVDRSIWWKVTSEFGTGYIIEDYLRPTTDTPALLFDPAGPDQPFVTTAATTLYETTSTASAVIAELPAGTEGVVTRGSWLSGRSIRWRVSTPYGDGYVNEDTIRPA